MAHGTLITVARLGPLSPGMHPLDAGAALRPHSARPVIVGSIRDMEKRLVREAIEKTKGNKTQGTKLLASRVSGATRASSVSA